VRKQVNEHNNEHNKYNFLIVSSPSFIFWEAEKSNICIFFLLLLQFNAEHQVVPYFRFFSDNTLPSITFLRKIKCRIYSLNNPFPLLFQKEFKAFFNILRPGKQLAKTTKSCTRNSSQIVAIV
jgi:hypothetical protein